MVTRLLSTFNWQFPHTRRYELTPRAAVTSLWLWSKRSPDPACSTPQQSLSRIGSRGAAGRSAGMGSTRHWNLHGGHVINFWPKPLPEWRTFHQI